MKRRHNSKLRALIFESQSYEKNASPSMKTAQLGNITASNNPNSFEIREIYLKCANIKYSDTVKGHTKVIPRHRFI